MKHCETERGDQHDNHGKRVNPKGTLGNNKEHRGIPGNKKEHQGTQGDTWEQEGTPGNTRATAGYLLTFKKVLGTLDLRDDAR